MCCSTRHKIEPSTTLNINNSNDNFSTNCAEKPPLKIRKLFDNASTRSSFINTNNFIDISTESKSQQTKL